MNSAKAKQKQKNIYNTQILELDIMPNFKISIIS